MLRTITNNFALLTVVGVALAWFYPSAFTWMTDGSIQVAGQPLLSVALGLVMLAMGLTLTFEDYRSLAKLPKALLAGVALQFAVMPLAGFGIAQITGLEQGLAVGLEGGEDVDVFRHPGTVVILGIELGAAVALVKRDLVHWS